MVIVLDLVAALVGETVAEVDGVIPHPFVFRVVPFAGEGGENRDGVFAASRPVGERGLSEGQRGGTAVFPVGSVARRVVLRQNGGRWAEDCRGRKE